MGIRSDCPEMVGKKHGHFPGQEQPDVRRPYGDHPRLIDTRFFDADDTVVRFAEAEKKP